jgi:hypothetical protein
VALRPAAPREDNLLSLSQRPRSRRDRP